MKVLPRTLWVLLSVILPSALIGLATEQHRACVLAKGSGYASATYWTYESSTFWNSNGKEKDAYNEFEQQAVWLFLQYGLTNCDTLSIEGGWARIEESLDGKAFGFEDVEIGWKHCFGTKWYHTISAQVIGIIPSETEFKPGLRYGQFGGEIDLMASKGIHLLGCRGSYDLNLGYRFYEGFPSDQIRAYYGINLFPCSRLMLTGCLQLEYGLFNGDSRKDTSFFLLNPNYRLLRGQLEAQLYLIKGVSLTLGYQQHLWGRNIGTNGGVYGGASLTF